MLDKLQVNGTVKNYLISIDNETKTYYTDMISKSDDNLENAVSEFIENVTAILDYYTIPIFDIGKKIIISKTGNNNDLETFKEKFINSWKTNDLTDFYCTLKTAILHCFNDRTTDDSLYDEIIIVIITNCLKLLRKSQLEICKELGINKIRFSSSSDSCQICQAKSKIQYNIDDAINQLDEFHPFCKLLIEIENSKYNDIQITGTNIHFNNIPVALSAKAKNIVGMLRIYIKDFITDKKFVFIDDMLQDDMVETIKNNCPNNYEEILEKLRNRIVFYDTDDTIFISAKHPQSIEYVIVLALLKDNILKRDMNWWRDQFAKKLASKNIGDNTAIFTSPFITYNAQQTFQFYLLESVVSYILMPRFLKDMDPENYNEIKSKIFNEVEFLRG